jgi:hypothetical protein
MIDHPPCSNSLAVLPPNILLNMDGCSGCTVGADIVAGFTGSIDFARLANLGVAVGCPSGVGTGRF